MFGYPIKNIINECSLNNNNTNLVPIESNNNNSQSGGNNNSNDNSNNNLYKTIEKYPEPQRGSNHFKFGSLNLCLGIS